jgi:hypothetical protein
MAYGTIHHKKKVELVEQRKETLSDGSIREVSIWKLSVPTPERAHGYKYRLQYCLLDGSTLVRYDNRTGKGDHKHLREKILPYKFVSVEQLIRDFNVDIKGMGGLI